MVQFKVFVLVALVVCSVFIVNPVVFGEDGGLTYIDSYPNETISSGNTTDFSGVQSGIQFFTGEDSIRLKCFAPAVITLRYEEASAYFVNASSFRDRDHNEAQSPKRMIVYIDGLDTYFLSFQVFYDFVVNQTVLLEVEQGSNSTLSFEIPLACVNKGFVLDVEVETFEEPSYPTEQELWEYGAGQQQQWMNQVTEENDRKWFLAVVLGVVGVACVVVAFLLIGLLIRKQRHQDYKINNFNSETRF